MRCHSIPPSNPENSPAKPLFPVSALSRDHLFEQPLIQEKILGFIADRLHDFFSHVLSRYHSHTCTGERLLEAASQKFRVAQLILRGIGIRIRRVDRNYADILSRQLLASCIRDEVQSRLARAISDQARNSGSAVPELTLMINPPPCWRILGIAACIA